MDIQYLLLLQELREATGGFLTSFFTFITTIGVDYYVAIPALIIFWTIDKKKGAQVLMTWGTSLGVNAALKSTFCVYRPWIRSSEIHPVPEVISGATGYSFPSGHSTSASGFYCGIITVYRKYKGLCIFATAMILLTMFSRNYVGVHTPQDVLIGGATGVVVAILINKVLIWVEENPAKDYMVLIAVSVICLILLCYIYFKPYPMDYIDGQLLVDPKKMTVDGFKDPGIFFGTILGWFLERRFVRFDISGTNYQKLMRCLVGGLLYVFICTAVFGPIGKAIAFGPVYFVLQAAQVTLFMTVYPMVFKWVENKKA